MKFRWRNRRRSSRGSVDGRGDLWVRGSLAADWLRGVPGTSLRALSGPIAKSQYLVHPRIPTAPQLRWLTAPPPSANTRATDSPALASRCKARWTLPNSRRELLGLRVSLRVGTLKKQGTCGEMGQVRQLEEKPMFMLLLYASKSGGTCNT